MDSNAEAPKHNYAALGFIGLLTATIEKQHASRLPVLIHQYFPHNSVAAES